MQTQTARQALHLLRYWRQSDLDSLLPELDHADRVCAPGRGLPGDEEERCELLSAVSLEMRRLARQSLAEKRWPREEADLCTNLLFHLGSNHLGSNPLGSSHLGSNQRLSRQ